MDPSELSLYNPISQLIEAINDVAIMIKQQYFKDKNNEKEIVLSSISIILCSLLAYIGMDNITKRQYDDLIFRKIGKSSSLFSNGNNESYNLLVNAINFIRHELIVKENKYYSQILFSNNCYIDSYFTPLETFIEYLQKIGNIERLDLNEDTKKTC